jgi:hypothetical protein
MIHDLGTPPAPSDIGTYLKLLKKKPPKNYSTGQVAVKYSD